MFKDDLIKFQFNSFFFVCSALFSFSTCDHVKRRARCFFFQGHNYEEKATARDVKVDIDENFNVRHVAAKPIEAHKRKKTNRECPFLHN